jgi:hypothetical protein
VAAGHPLFAFTSHCVTQVYPIAFCSEIEAKPSRLKSPPVSAHTRWGPLNAQSKDLVHPAVALGAVVNLQQ